MRSNYNLIASNKKATRELDLTKLPDVKKAILTILTEDYLFWRGKGLPQQGLDRNRLVSKVSLIVHSNLFDIALNEIEETLQVISYQQDSVKRYILPPKII